MNSDKLTHLIYSSAATSNFNSADLKTILQAARNKNARLSVTGMLLCIGGAFFQVLEGVEAMLFDLFSTISSDPRHKNVTKIIHEPIAQRTFNDWTMGYAELGPSELEAIDGFGDFFRQGQTLADLQPGRAKKLLVAFAQGRWRERLKSNGT
jgi:hypothetical protein